MLRHTITGDSGAITRIQKFQAIMAMVAWADRWGPVVAAELRHEAPVQGRYKPVTGGALRDSIKWERRSAFGGVALVFHTDVPYAKYVLEGTPAHYIPASKEWLRWEDFSGVQWRHFGVNHPGAAKNPFSRRVADRVVPEMADSLAEMFRQEL
jgi:hypothetical protein